jgi:flagellar biosynthesis/type III secretory pathway protein FliH
LPGAFASRLDALDRRLRDLERDCACVEAGLAGLKDNAAREGREIGRSEGLAAMCTALSEADRICRQTAEAAATDAVDLAFRLAAKVVDAEVESRPELLSGLVAQWRDSAGWRDGFIVCLNPDDAASMRPFLDGAPGCLAVSDPSLPRGACRIEDDGVIYEIGFDAALSSIREAAG